MKKYLLLLQIVGLLSTAALIYSMIATGKHISGSGEPKYRIMCWFPDGQPFYDGFSPVVEATDSYTAFMPMTGPQVGMKIYTTNPCTWGEAK